MIKVRDMRVTNRQNLEDQLNDFDRLFDDEEIITINYLGVLPTGYHGYTVISRTKDADSD